ncbi:MAG: hypothetical protein WC655_29890 [Candidatus Hydrogenedentales bacterium]|jgi:hypothetical protein
MNEALRAMVPDCKILGAANEAPAEAQKRCALLAKLRDQTDFTPRLRKMFREVAAELSQIVSRPLGSDAADISAKKKIVDLWKRVESHPDFAGLEASSR